MSGIRFHANLESPSDMSSTSEAPAFAHRAYAILTNDDEGRICKDIPETACHDQPGNFLRHVVSLGATKTADGLADAKLVLAWLMGALGAPAYLIGFLVPVREAGALLPQLAIAGAIRARPIRKWIWAGGSVIQGLAVIGIGLAALFLEGVSAGWVIVGLLALAALARGACSVSYKDVLGKTVSKSTRGTATGAAGSISAVLVLAFGAALAFGILPRTVASIAAVLAVAGGLWLFAAAVFATLTEAPGATEGGGNALAVAREHFALLGQDAQLRRFILTRALLIATALSPPYLLAVAGGSSGISAAAGSLGPFVIASALASILSAYVWGRLSDRSSRQVLIVAALLASGTLLVSGLVAMLAPGWMALPLVPAVLLFLIMVAHQGVRLGRSTHVVDMAGAERRASYTALSNTIIGIVLVAGGLFGVLAHWLGAAAVLLTFAGMALLAAVVGRGLEEVQQDG